MMWTIRANQYRPFSFALFLALALAAAGGQQRSLESNPNLTFEQLSAQATSSREAGRADDAIRDYQHALKMQPDWEEGWWYLGTLNYDTDRYAEAASAFQKLIVLNPRMAPALAFLGLSEFETKEYKNSIAHLQRAQRFGYGDDAELAKVAAYHLALLYNWSGEFDKTFEVLGTAIKQGRPPDGMKVALGMALLRVPLLATEVDPGKDALIHAAGEAAVLLNTGRAAAAADTLRQLSADYPKTPYLHYACAKALAAAGKSEEALGELAAESAGDPRESRPWVLAASLYLQRGRPKDALPAARKAVQLAPFSSEAHEILAKTLTQLNRRLEAAKESAVARKLETRPVEGELAQRQFYARGGTEEGGLAHAAAAAPASGGGFEALSGSAAAAQSAGQLDEAISSYQSALAIRPDWEEGWRNLGTVCYTAARYADAITALKNSVALNPHNGNAWALLGLSEFETRDYKNSLIHLDRGRDVGFAGNAAAVQVATYHLAILLNRSGEFDRATELLAPETALGPLKDEVVFALGMSLLRIPRLPEELDHSNDSLVRLAGKTAALLSESKYDQAFSGFELLMKMNSSTPYLHYAYGSALASASRYDEADEELAQETKITPESSLPFLRRSSIALQLHQAEKAAQFAQRAVQLAPDSAEGHYLIGRSLLELGRVADSVKELETARGLSPNSPEVHFSLARAYAKAEQSDAAVRERADFERLNALVQSQQGRSGSQAYGAIQDHNGIRAAPGKKPDQPQDALPPQ
jgi:tetratricopeptide (TPR) repeat protein